MKERILLWLFAPWFWALLCFILLNRYLHQVVPTMWALFTQDVPLPWTQIVIEGVVQQIPAIVTCLLFFPLATRQSSWRGSILCTLLYTVLSCAVMGGFFIFRDTGNDLFGDWAREWFTHTFPYQALIIITCCCAMLFFIRADRYR